MMTVSQSMSFALTLFVAFILTLLPMPDWTVWLRPAWILLVLIFWVSMWPNRYNVGIAWMIGIFLDVLNGTVLGEHALALTMVIYLVQRMHSRFRMFPMMQQGLSVCLFVFIYQFILYCVQGFLGDLPVNLAFWLPPFTSMLLWPWVYGLLQDIERRFRVV